MIYFYREFNVDERWKPKARGTGSEKVPWLSAFLQVIQVWNAVCGYESAERVTRDVGLRNVQGGRLRPVESNMRVASQQMLAQEDSSAFVHVSSSGSLHSSSSNGSFTLPSASSTSRIPSTIHYVPRKPRHHELEADKYDTQPISIPARKEQRERVSPEATENVSPETSQETKAPVNYSSQQPSSDPTEDDQVSRKAMAKQRGTNRCPKF